jgi:uncharacterized protein YqhQ
VSEKLTIGGQAVIEGVMMRSPHAFTVAVRQGGRTDAPIALLTEQITPIGERFPLLKKPVLRGSFALFEALWLGMRALNFSANEAIETEDGKKEELSPLAMAGTMLLALGFALGLFLGLPLLLTHLLGAKYAAFQGNVLFNLTDGAIRVGLFVGYISGISFMKDIRRVFQYHGAEHKVIGAYEAGMPLTVESCRSYSCIHPRCGTSFLMVVIVLSIILFALVPAGWPLWAKAAARFVLLPLIAGISYEFIRFSAKKRGNALVEALILPGLLLQRLTTRVPSDDQIEVAIRAMVEALAREPR